MGLAACSACGSEGGAFLVGAGFFLGAGICMPGISICCASAGALWQMSAVAPIGHKTNFTIKLQM